MKQYSFIKPDWPPRSSLMVFGYDCGEGWYPLIEELFDKIDYLLKTKYPQDNEEFPFEVIQVKEKFGTLRVYVYNAPDEIFDLIDEYERKSAKICEKCGKPAQIHNYNGWYYTRCDECYRDIINRVW